MNERVALYGHDTMGLGHVRRNLALAAALRSSRHSPQVLVITGATEAGRFPLPDGVDLLVLPGVAKDESGGYRSRRLHAPLADVVALRSSILTAALMSFQPHLLVVDKVARGFAGELEPILPALRDAGTRMVLGLRDVLDGPPAAATEWRTLQTTEALRHYYDEAWVYGDRRVSDLASDCRVPPSVRRLLRYTGFLATGRPGTAAGPLPIPGGEPYVLGLLGGGQDGAELAEAFAAAPRPAGVAGVLVTGPYLPATTRAALHAAAAADPDLHIVDFCADPISWTRRASAVMCMGGYNTVCEVLSTDTPALLVPRVRPRTEQFVRARRLSELGLVDDMHPRDLTPALLGHWTAEAVTRPRRPRLGVDLCGMDAVRHFAEAHFEEARRAA
ncbi:glycosyltransferase family protein [Nonomuraea polychroma]|uniref:glycosyltransferase family protein n=1 Tax=Nonomuraea polychroma TaxID=46176 RepID=UPI003D8C562D